MRRVSGGQGASNRGTILQSSRGELDSDLGAGRSHKLVARWAETDVAIRFRFGVLDVRREKEKGLKGLKRFVRNESLVSA